MSQPQIKTDIESRLLDSTDTMTGMLYFKDYSRVLEAHPTDLSYTAICLDSLNGDYFTRIANFCYSDGRWNPVLQKWKKDGTLLDDTQLVFNHFTSTFHSKVNGNNILLGTDAVNKVLFRNDGSNFWLLITDIGTDGYNDLRPLRVELSTGNVWVEGGRPLTTSNLKTIYGRSISNNKVDGQPIVHGYYTELASNRYANGGLQIRENDLVGSAQSSMAYAPSIGFHWSGRIAGSLLLHSDGIFYFRKQDGVSRATIDAEIKNGWKSYSRSDIGTSPNFDDPGVNGLFEVRSTSETTGETGTKPFNSFGPILTMKSPDNIVMLQLAGAGTNFYIRCKQSGNVTLAGVAWRKIWTQGDTVTGAVWNDYAECREADTIEPGYVLIEVGDDTLTKSTERLQSFYGVSSDTYGFSQGETERAKTPIAVAGRALVYPYQDRENYKPGQCVCAAPGGTVDIMTEEEIYKHPDRIVGIVSCVPTYEEWGGGESADREPVKVNGRIWIKVK